MNTENLLKMNDVPPEVRRANASKAGKASAKKRREKRKLKEELLLLLREGDTQRNMCAALITEALNGNTKAFEVVRDTIGQKPKEEIELDSNVIKVTIDDD